jgi:FkbM family methyltransferase
MKKIPTSFARKLYNKLPADLKNKIWRSKTFIKSLLNRKQTAIPAVELEVFRAIKDEMHIVFDIGARTDLSFYNIKNNCEYHLFEPNKKFVTLLKKQISKLKEHKITVNEFGLSDYESDNNVYYEDSQSFVVNPVVGSTDKGHRYSLKTLDKYVAEKKIPKIDFLKIDAEGMDYRILLGAVKTLESKVKYIQFEYWDGVQKFVELLTNFDLYLMIEPRLRAAIRKFTDDKKYDEERVSLTEDVIELIDTKLIPSRAGGNIFAVKK